MLDDIFANNEGRLRDLRKHYAANTVATMVNDRLKTKNINETVSGSEIDGFLKVSRLSKNVALVPKPAYKKSMELASIGSGLLPA